MAKSLRPIFARTTTVKFPLKIARRAVFVLCVHNNDVCERCGFMLSNWRGDSEPPAHLNASGLKCRPNK